MRNAPTLATLLATTLLSAAAAHASDALPELPAGLTTHADGRVPLGELLEAYQPLLDAGWRVDQLIDSHPRGAPGPLPIFALRTPQAGPAAWFIAGIHGEEPAGPVALAAAVPELAALGRRMAVVVVPLANPHGYARNWRYLNQPEWSADSEGQSVGDSSHWLEDPEQPGRPRAQAPSSPEAAALTRYAVERALTYPPRYSIDLHEDSLLAAGYVYSQGAAGAHDPLAVAAVAVLVEHGIAVQQGGETRFGEPIEGGIIGPVIDGSIDELMSAARVLEGGAWRAGPAAPTVLVFETPARDAPLARRVDAHLALVRRLAERMRPGDGESQQHPCDGGGHHGDQRAAEHGAQPDAREVVAARGGQ